MPNLFPEGGNEPLYNTVDAALLFINCVYLYYEATKDVAFVKEMYPVMERISKVIEKGPTMEFAWIQMVDSGGRRIVAGNMDGCACRRDFADTKTWKTG